VTLALLMGVASAAQLSLNVPTRQLSVGESVPIELQIVDASVSGVPDIPVGGGLSLNYEGSSQSRVIVNFRSTSITSYSYGMTALSEGSWTVGPVTLNAGGQTLTAPAVQITVAPRSQAARAERDVSATLSDASPWLGQVVVYRFRFQHKGDVLDARWTPPGFDGFVREPSAEMAQHEIPLVVDGERYTVQQIDVPLVAVGAGTRTIGPAMLTAQVPASNERSRRNDPFADSPFRAFRDVTSETLTADAIPLTIRPLPDEGKPAGFAGLIGHFSLSVQPSASAVKLGESLTLDVELSGDGSLTGFHLPSPAADAGYRVYDADPTVSAEVDEGNFIAKASFRLAVVPEHEGTLTIPGLHVPYFDPEKGGYAWLDSGPVQIDVQPGEANAGKVTSYAGQDAGARPPAALGEDILPVSGEARIGDRALGAALLRYLVPPAVPALGLVGLELARALGRRRKDPWDELAKSLAKLPTDPRERLGALEQIFREAAGIRLKRPPAGLDRGAVATLGEDARTLYADLEAARYGGLDVENLEARVRAFVARRGA